MEVIAVKAERMSDDENTFQFSEPAVPSSSSTPATTDQEQKDPVLSDLPHKCDECNRSFRLKSGLINHRKRHQKRDLHECKICGEKFKLQVNLTRHTHKYCLKFECSECDKRFSSQKQLSMHKLLHGDDPSFTCIICGKIYKMYHNFQRHVMASHPEMLSNPITMNLNSENEIMSSGATQTLANNLPSCSSSGVPNLLAEIPKYACVPCEVFFKYKWQLAEHYRTSERHRKINQEGPPLSDMSFHYCSICGRPFKTKRELSLHCRSHANGPSLVGAPMFSDMPFSCGFCRKSFRYKWQLSIHVREDHLKKMSTGDVHLCSTVGHSESQATN